ncbi:MAG: hypothetical protein ABR585_07585 [Gemmatimonadaceae bacterium]
MRWLPRRHRGSQTGDVAPFVRIGVVPAADPAEIAEITARWPRLDSKARDKGSSEKTAPTLTARQVLTASLTRDLNLANEPDHVMTLVDDILLDLDEHGLTIVASSEVE